MADYKIVGPLPVADREPGSTLTDEDLELFNVEWLIELGHIAPVKAGKADTAPTNKED